MLYEGGIYLTDSRWNIIEKTTVDFAGYWCFVQNTGQRSNCGIMLIDDY